MESRFSGEFWAARSEIGPEMGLGRDTGGIGDDWLGRSDKLVAISVRSAARPGAAVRRRGCG